ncbi:hypothetical protein, partial [Agrobacterium sp.]|uniref:hypothetical protein n=1 Tax=Agrobacterium sp. TaxID=361 RepID=UPI0040338540
MKSIIVTQFMAHKGQAYLALIGLTWRVGQLLTPDPWQQLYTGGAAAAAAAPLFAAHKLRSAH